MADHHDHPTDYAAPVVATDYGPYRRLSLLAGLIGLAAWAGMGVANMATYTAHDGGEPPHGGERDLYLTYLVGYVFWLCIPIGAMALSYLAFLTSASWGLVFRRCFQAATRTWPWVLGLSIPIVVSLFRGEESAYWWVIPAAEIDEWKGKGLDTFVTETSHRQQQWLNWPTFVISSGLILGLYMLLSMYLNRWSLKAEDEGDEASRSKLRGLAGPAVLLWALTFTMLMTNLVMSVEVAWASTMFGVVAGMNAFLTTFAFCTIVFYTLVGTNDAALSVVKDKFRIDIGSLTLGFAMVWSYATFSQYMLIYAGNLPEEITYIKRRTEGGWQWMAYLLMAVHWFLPFIILLFREVKTDPKKMRRVAVMLLAICAVDVTWWVVPAVPHPDQFLHLPMAAAAIVGVGGVWCFAFFGELSKRNILPKKDAQFMATWGHH